MQIIKGEGKRGAAGLMMVHRGEEGILIKCFSVKKLEKCANEKSGKKLHWGKTGCAIMFICVKKL